jgi:alpha-tubulin suppressor-like RCC1 family protein
VVLDQYGDPFSGLTLVWASDDATVATVDASGVVRSVRDGETTIRVQAGTVRGSVHVEIGQEPFALEILAGDGQSHWTGFLLNDTLKVKLSDRAGTAVVGEDVTWEVLDGEGNVFPEASRTDADGELRALWVLGPGESGVQRLSATAAELDPVIFEATGSAPITLLNASPLTGLMLDTISAFLLTSDSLGIPESGIPVEFRDITGFGEIAQGPTTSDVNGELKAGWALGPTPGPQEVTVVRTDIGAELTLEAQATGTLDPWPFTAVAAGSYHTCAVDDVSSGYCWGLNDRSQLSGVADTLPVDIPTAVSGGLTWEDIQGGDFHSCGLTTGGSIYCWGQGYQTGQPGDSTTVTEDPAVVGGGAYESLAVGAYHTCGVKPDGRGLCWGEDVEGRLGNGTLESTNTPTEISGGFSWIELSAGHFHTCGIEAGTGDAYCWGQGTEGQLGDGGIDNMEAPALVANDINWMTISAGRFHTCGISTTGDGFCWGEGGFNQLGIGSTADQTSPALLVGGHHWKDITAGQWHSCGVDHDDKLYCWGRSGSVGLGQLRRCLCSWHGRL